MRPAFPNLSRLLEHRLFHQSSLVLSALAALFYLVSFIGKQTVYTRIAAERADLLAVDPAFSCLTWLTIAANLLFATVILCAALLALPRFPASTIGAGLLLVLSQLVCSFDDALCNSSSQLCVNLGLSGTSVSSAVISDEIVQTCLVLVLDAMETLGGALLGMALWHAGARLRPLAFVFLCLAVWAAFDFAGLIIAPNLLAGISATVFNLICIAGACAGFRTFYLSARTPAAPVEPRPVNSLVAVA